MSAHFILYSKPDCCLCEGLEEKLRQIPTIKPDLEIRDITTRDEWMARYSLEVPVLYWQDEAGNPTLMPRQSPRATVAQIEAEVCRYVNANRV